MLSGRFEIANLSRSLPSLDKSRPLQIVAVLSQIKHRRTI